MDKIRLATQEELASIRSRAEITPQSSVFAFGEGEKADLAVLRLAPELDPVFFAASTDNRRKSFFIWALENGLRMMGSVPHYYFNVAASDEPWQKVVENWGAERISPVPEYRYIKKL